MVRMNYFYIEKLYHSRITTSTFFTKSNNIFLYFRHFAQVSFSVYLFNLLWFLSFESHACFHLIFPLQILYLVV